MNETERAALQYLDLDPNTYQRHLIHSEGRIWSETNCYVDVWFELLHALGAEPLAAAAFALSSDFEDPQWSFFKPPPEDLRAVFGLEVAEMNVWRPVIDHVEEQLRLGRLLTAEVDSWWLPDTAGVSYAREHVKTTIVVNALDRHSRTLGYFHGAGYHTLSGEDFDGIFAPALLPPYAELIRFDRWQPQPPDIVARASRLAVDHLRRRPPGNPVVRLGEVIERSIAALSVDDPEEFHRFAFGTCRQCGANAEVAASFCAWLDKAGGLPLGAAAEHLTEVAEAAKSLQFALARVARGRRVDLSQAVSRMADSWARAGEELDRVLESSID